MPVKRKKNENHNIVKVNILKELIRKIFMRKNDHNAKVQHFE